MARIFTYDQDADLNLNDKVIGSNSGDNVTKNFSVQSLLDLANSENFINQFDGIVFKAQDYNVDADSFGIITTGTGTYTSTNFSDIQTLYLTDKNLQNGDVSNYIDVLAGYDVRITKKGDTNNFGIYRVDSVTDVSTGQYKILSVSNQDASGKLEKGVEYVFDNDALYNEFQTSLADVYNSLNLYEKSDSLYELVLQKNPDNIIVLNNYSYYLSLRKKNLEKAKTMSKRCNELEPNNGTYQDTYAWILYCLTEYKSALEWIERAIKNGGDKSAVIIEHYGDILFKLGQKQEAVNQWKRAKSIGEGSDLLNKKINNEDIIIASHNEGKVSEIKDLLKNYDLRTLSSSDLGIDEPEENGSSFEENALIKASVTSTLSKTVSISDDSGLCVNALNGEPGIYSARWAGPKKDFLYAANKIQESLLKIEATDYSAYFICVLAVSWPDGDYRIYKGRVDGTLSFPPRGKNGFGYDPIFIPLGYENTFGEMDPQFKHSISHRNHAFNLFSKELLIEE